ncbi:hypothetical protein BABINDRAFT_119972 [Babjeviella inositovora NRRL Y-12698]|uniref:Uncharacterized protein n=1 Tax=Babjeviella inositovora NRRL Y-12698 TaxID=984486 RepID=A0A1E3QTU6_9ASCO|nr:uncharacterized protein BABINDRAFT_119972 [Babjeviella inositovora NRRL Y-12698]ODQ81090.1 hypothetical protein BABINDRAFT_119972 [Babjeviella inositovora NRRL Y-12698]
MNAGISLNWILLSTSNQGHRSTDTYRYISTPLPPQGLISYVIMSDDHRVRRVCMGNLSSPYKIHMQGARGHVGYYARLGHFYHKGKPVLTARSRKS